ncbi:MFS transporter [Nocardioides terrisoli]|uniref:MFS transporter n=1 Tax=Nocardioides terrisoli TaxID=3388267 RepID=UPI00287BC335|nr:MFS transporter [Nocardioides marmorisolisilvae]
MIAPWQTVRTRLTETVGGRARLRVIALLAAVLALDSADKATVGAVAGELEASLHIGNTEIGLLASVSTAIAMICTLPLGIVADRGNRSRLLAVAVLVWSAAMAVAGVSTSYLMLLLCQVAMGGIAAAAGPTIASLTGDLFPAGERGRIYGFVLSGELIGAGVGFLVSGDVAAVLSWRWSFWVLAVPGMALAAAVWRGLPEPARGGQEPLPIEAPDGADAEPEPTEDRIREAVDESDVEPRGTDVLTRDPTGRSLWWAVRYVLSIRTNRVLILSSALGYFFFSGVRTFAVVFMRGKFGLDQGVASSLLVLIGCGAIVGVLLTGRLADRLVARHHLTARPVLAGAAYLLAVVMFVPGLLAGSLLLTGALFFFAAAGVGGSNPPLDAARLDVVHFALWGRAEAVRSVFRSLLEAVAPLLFGYVSTLFGSSTASLGSSGGVTSSNGVGLQQTFLVMLVPLLASGLLLCLRARRSYPADVAAAVASERSTPAR